MEQLKVDLINLIKEKVEVLSHTDSYVGLKSVISHIEIAERHLMMGKEGDDYLFTDVIYRTNQAFEGSLKEAFTVLTGKTSEKKTSYQIEKFLESQNLLKERVLSLFSNYRTEWRNESTHNYKLYFSEQESFLAIISISAFFSILLDQMIEAIAYQKEKAELKNKQNLTSATYSEQNFMSQIVELLTKFAEDLPQKIVNNNTMFNEREINGMLAAYIVSADPSIKVFSDEFLIFGSRKMRPDFRLEKNKDVVLVEVKRTTAHMPRTRQGGYEQLVSYLTATSDIEKGILFIPPLFKNQKITIKNTTVEIDNKNKIIVEIYPKTSTNKSK